MTDTITKSVLCNKFKILHQKESEVLLKMITLIKER